MPDDGDDSNDEEDDDDQCLASKYVTAKQFDILLKLFLEWSWVVWKKISLFFQHFSMKTYVWVQLRLRCFFNLQHSIQVMDQLHTLVNLFLVHVE